MDDERCGTCKFYKIEEETKRGHINDDEIHEDDFEAECRRYPPVRGDKDYFGSINDPDLLRDFFSGPSVQTTNWCGEWRKR